MPNQAYQFMVFSMADGAVQIRKKQIHLAPKLMPLHPDSQVASQHHPESVLEVLRIWVKV